MADFNSLLDEEAPFTWKLSVDGASNFKGSDTEMVLKGPYNILME